MTQDIELHFLGIHQARDSSIVRGTKQISSIADTGKLGAGWHDPGDKN